MYCYPDTDNVLINKFDIRDKTLLDAVERDISTQKIASLQSAPPRGFLDYTHLKAIHKHIFQDIYSWAGKLRSVNIAKQNTMFCNVQFVEGSLKDVSAKLAKEKFLIGTDIETFSSRVAYYFAEINIIHPFREGNGRSQRAFTELLGKVAGYDIDFAKVSEADMLAASIHCWKGDESKFADIFMNISTPISVEDRLACANIILNERSSALKIVRGLSEKAQSMPDELSFNERMKIIDNVKFSPVAEMASSSDVSKVIPRHDRG